jgi:hypothetical protein
MIIVVSPSVTHHERPTCPMHAPLAAIRAQHEIATARLTYG